VHQLRGLREKRPWRLGLLVDAESVAPSLHLCATAVAAIQRTDSALRLNVHVHDQREFRRVHDALSAYEKRIHFSWKPTSFPAQCDLPGSTPVAAQ